MDSNTQEKRIIRIRDKTHPPFCIAFDSSYFHENDRIDAWTFYMDSLFETKPLHDDSDFNAQFLFYMVDHCAFGSARFTPQQYQRTTHAYNDYRPDHVYLQLILSGGYSGYNGRRELQVQSGDIVLYDLGLETKTVTGACDSINMFIARDVASDLGLLANPHVGTKLPRGSRLAGILGSYMHGISMKMPGMTYQEATIATQDILHMIRASFAAKQKGVDQLDDAPELGSAQTQRICNWIEGQLGNPGLSVKEICNSTYVSRSTLYRLFEKFGGVTSYIHSRRLSNCFKDLVMLNHPDLTVTQISEHWGYKNYPQFSRLFKRRYGFSPREVASSPCVFVEHAKDFYGAGQSEPDSKEWIKEL